MIEGGVMMFQPGMQGMQGDYSHGAYQWVQSLAQRKAYLDLRLFSNVADLAASEPSVEHERAPRSTWAATMGQLPHALVVLDRLGAVVWLNRRAEETLEMSYAEAAGRPLGDVGGPFFEDEASVFRALSGLADNDVWEEHTTVRTRDGLLPVSLTLSWIVEAGARIGILAMFQQGTLIHAAPEEPWQNVLQEVPAAILIYGDDQILYLNDACGQLLGCDDPASTLRHAPHRYIPRRHLARLRKRFSSQDDTELFRHAITCEDGSQRIVESVARPYTFQGVRSVLLFIRPVEQPDEARCYAPLLENLPEKVWCASYEPNPPDVETFSTLPDERLLQGSLILCNEGMRTLLGDEGTGRRLENVGLLKQIVSSADGEAEQPTERVVRFTNEETTYRSTTIPVVEDGLVTHLWGTCEEVSSELELKQQYSAALEVYEQRIGRELHDSIGSLLTVIRTLSNNLASEAENDRIRMQAQSIENFTARATQHLRAIHDRMAPGALMAGGTLAEACEGLVESMTEWSRTACSFTCTGEECELEPKMTFALYRIVQEALTNAMKHANADHVAVRLEYRPDGTVAVEVEDDGAGFDEAASARPTTSLGLTSMRLRAEAIGGLFTVTSAPGKGCRVRCLLPAAIVAPPPNQEDSPS